MSISLVVATVLACAAMSLWWYWLRAPVPPAPLLPGTWTDGTLQHGDADRTFLSFVPSSVQAAAPIVVVLHGSRSNGQQIRGKTGFEFERLAVRDGFIVVYPDGVGGYWNDCRVKGNWASKRRNVDDVGFLAALVAHLQARRAAGPAFFVGYSNGGHMCFRMSCEAPVVASAVAVVAANLPTTENFACALPSTPSSVMLVNGTDDPINPYDGGRVTIFGFGDRGTVHSAVRSAEILASGLGSDVTSSAPAQLVLASSSERAWVDRTTWASSTGEVALVTVHGGGHAVPQPHYRYPRLVGRTEMRFNAPSESWTFFRRAMMRGDTESAIP